MILHHGTTTRNSNLIDNSGEWLGTVATESNMDLSNGDIDEGGFVFCHLDAEAAGEYGAEVAAITIDKEHVSFYRNCPVTGIPEYIVRAADVNEHGAWEWL